MAWLAPRPGSAEDALGGVVPGLAYEPADVREAAEVVGASAREGLRLGFVGGGTERDLGAAPEALEAVIRTGALTRIVEYAPADQIVVAEAGLTLDGLQAVLARERQRLSLDPPWAGRATLGGAVAANAFGPLRTRHGGMRDLLVGMTMIRADGALVRSGGKVVKNVAGFDLFRLQVGALGTLGLVAEVALRVHPLPEVRRTVWFPGAGPPQVWSLVQLMREARLEPAAVAGVGGAARLEVGVLFEGFEAGVTDQVRRTLALAVQAGLPVEPTPQAGQAFWARHAAAREQPAFAAKLTALPSVLQAVCQRAVAPLEVALDGSRLVTYPTLGLAFVTGTPGDEAAVAGAVETSRRALLDLGGALSLSASSPSLVRRADPWGPPPGGLQLMRQLKLRLDPTRRLAPGRLVGGI
jgi:glycolate oxidase FAD binding subunit